MSDDVDFMAGIDAEELLSSRSIGSFSQWITKSGETIELSEMGSDHLSNTIKYLENVILGNRNSDFSESEIIVYLINMKLELLKRFFKQ